MTTRRRFIEKAALGSAALALGLRANATESVGVSSNVLNRRLQLLWTSKEGRVVRHAHNVLGSAIHYGDNQLLAPSLKIKVYPHITLSEVHEFNQDPEAHLRPIRLDNEDRQRVPLEIAKEEWAYKSYLMELRGLRPILIHNNDSEILVTFYMPPNREFKFDGHIVVDDRTGNVQTQKQRLEEINRILSFWDGISPVAA